MRQVASTIVVVTSYVSGRPWGTTISGFLSVSMNPPLCLVSLMRHSAILMAVQDRLQFGVGILPSSHAEIARRASVPGSPKFIDELCTEISLTSDATSSPGTAGTFSVMSTGDTESFGDPVIYGSLAHLNCTVDRVIPVSDHALVIGRVQEIVRPDPAGSTPLLYMDGTFRVVGDLAEGK